MLTRLLASGLLAGVIAGVLVAGIELATTVPLILEAERYENAASHAGHHASATVPHDALIHRIHGGEPHDVDAPSVAERQPLTLRRAGLTAIATAGTAAGFALMLLALMLASGAQITPPTAALWGAAGFAATGLAPAFGLAPELPGSAEIDLHARQLWWLATAATTAFGLWGLWRWRTLGPGIGCLALIAIPHVAGAPVAHAYASAVPAELAARFAASSLGIQAILWTTLGALSGWFWLRLGRGEVAR